jgi:hypothetical protein
MSVQGTSIKLLFGLLGLSLASGAYLYHLSPSERWLIFWGTEAKTYADAMLEKGSVPKEIKNDFIDVVTVTNPKKRTVLFSPHNAHEIAVVYAPDNLAESLEYENITAKRIKKNWYALP